MMVYLQKESYPLLSFEMVAKADAEWCQFSDVISSEIVQPFSSYIQF
jgi:hypothetical protein